MIYISLAIPYKEPELWELWSIYLSVYLSIYLSIYLYMYIYIYMMGKFRISIIHRVLEFHGFGTIGFGGLSRVFVF